MRNNSVRQIALAGVFASVAMVIMCMGGIIPVATYICPMLCTLTLFLVLRFCGGKLAWVWFAVVAILSLLMGPDKEAAVVFLTVGYYPLIKVHFDKSRFSLLWKLAFFDLSIFTVYSAFLSLFGLGEVLQENLEFGALGLIVILLMGNVTFLLLDKLLAIMAVRFK